jgi:hypothetical protein
MRSIEFGGSTMQGEATFLANASSEAPAAYARVGVGRRLLNHAVLLSTVAIGSLLLCGVGIWRFGSLAHARAYLQGYSVIPESSVIDLGHVESGTRVTGEIRLMNLSGQAVRIVGAESSCGCVAYEDLPIELPPRGSAIMRPWFDAPKISEADANHFLSQVEHPIRLLLDVQSPPIIVRLDAKVVPLPGPTLDSASMLHRRNGE